jgi:hypothetical protein
VDVARGEGGIVYGLTSLWRNNNTAMEPLGGYIAGKAFSSINLGGCVIIHKKKIKFGVVSSRMILDSL